METIIAYIDNIFKSLPKTAQLNSIRENILANMEEKYQERKAEGMSEHEAIGIVISEFGNIEELLVELGIKSEELASENVITMEEVDKFIAMKYYTSKIIAIGVSLCILGVAAYGFMTALVSKNYFPSLLKSDGEDLTGILPMFLMIAVAVGLFIYSGMKSEEFKSMQSGITLDNNTKDYLNTRFSTYKKRFYAAIITGVSLCLISPIFYLSLEQSMGTQSELPGALFLCLIACAVYLFVFSGVRYSAYDVPLQNANKTTTEKKQELVYGAVNACIMLTAVLIFLYQGFINNQWETAWVVFPIGGILCGIASTIIHFIFQSKEGVR